MAGGYGITALIEDTRQNPPRLLVLKRGIHDKGEDSIINEIYFLQLLASRERRWHEKSRGVWDLFGTRGRWLNGLQGASLVVDYVPNGSFHDLFTRLSMIWEFEDVHVPNRVLWSIMTCFVRASVGMTWPPNGEHKAVEELEKPDPTRAPTPLAHNDLHMENILFSEIQHGSAEHGLMPGIKIIDFGMAREPSEPPIGEPPPDYRRGIRNNTTNLASFVQSLITRRSPQRPEGGCYMDNGMATNADQLFLPQNRRLYPWLDPELRWIIGYMMATYEIHRPLLSDVLAVCERGVRKGPADFGNIPPEWRAFESDDNVVNFVARAFHDGQTSSDSSSSSNNNNQGGGRGGGGGGGRGRRVSRGGHGDRVGFLRRVGRYGNLRRLARLARGSLGTPPSPNDTSTSSDGNDGGGGGTGGLGGYQQLGSTDNDTSNGMNVDNSSDYETVTDTDSDGLPFGGQQPPSTESSGEAMDMDGNGGPSGTVARAQVDLSGTGGLVAASTVGSGITLEEGGDFVQSWSMQTWDGTVWGADME
ncbi:kinase-like domain-containing protein [Apiospora kogelbergensis]|uniref:kinase-like domain-containing protein n=1 Tax=Apiospora kogelbergensis TaxID=1337665 RepID=UPI0031309DA3